MDRLGLSYESLRQENPRLIYTAIRGFGDPRTGRSPYTDWPAFDVVAQAMGGFMGITGPGPGHPTKSGPGIGDIFPAALAIVGTLAALHTAQATGQGQFVDVAMYDGIVSLCERPIYQYSYTGEVAQPQGNTHPLLCPFDVFPTMDGHVAIAAPVDRHWQLLCDALGRPELGKDPLFATNSTRVANGEAVREIVADWTRTMTKADIISILGGQVPVGPVNTAEDVMSDPHVKAREMIVEMEQPGSARTIALAGNAIKMTGTPQTAFRRAPLLGEHAEEILREAGLRATEIAELRSAGIII
jgi:crotonobetainyl-CoA:carnitine CoA-transferase CaiB-like acyl-CoA transferase